MTKISIVIPAHNEEKYIQKTLNSLEQQTFQDFEIIVVCNGCTDKTEKIMYKKTNPQLKVFSLPEANVSKARNLGGEIARGELLVFLDADTILDQDSLQIINQQFQEQNAVATILSKPDQDQFKYKCLTGLKNFYHVSKIYQGCSGVLICRQKDFCQVNGYPNLKVMEHQKLIKKLKQFGDYTCLKTNATTSMRRHQQWNLTKSISFWVKQGYNNIFNNLEESDYERIR